MKVPKHFASDNFAGVHPAILKALTAANIGHQPAYGADKFTAAAIKKFQEHFGDQIEVFFVFGGTGANVLGLQAITASYQGILCAETAHINRDECGAPEKLTGCKLLPVPSANGKITVEQFAPWLADVGNEHHVQPKVISISQATEYGTVYTPEELDALAAFAHQHDMLLHVDGARLCNAAAFLKMNLRDVTADVGVDVLSFGGSKNGLMFGEAVIFFKRVGGQRVKYLRKQATQLMSKMRFLAAQFDAYLTNQLWLKNAQQANAMAQLLARELAPLPSVAITQAVEANAVFATLPKAVIPVMQEKFAFYVWNAATAEVRLMTSFDTTKSDVKHFIKMLRDTLQKQGHA